MTVAKTLKTLMLSSIATVALSASAMAADMTLKLGHPANEDNIWHKASVKFAEELEKRPPAGMTGGLFSVCSVSRSAHTGRAESR